MDVRFWRKACDHFERVVELPAEERAAYLRDLEPRLQRGVEALFAAEAEAGEFLQSPAVSPGMGEDLRAAANRAECLRLGPYRLERELSSSGMSRVFLARRDDGEFEKQVAVKVIAQEAASDDLLERFRRERQILANLDHPNIARLLDGGTTDEGLPYLVMELVEGTPIDEYCDAGRLSIPERLELFRQICSAVHYAHERGVVHRDIKASNILITEDGSPKLLDFGIAKLLQTEPPHAEEQETSPGVRPMTPYYASPEQVMGGAITRATDVYSLGVLLFKILAGSFPYRFPELTVEAVRAAVVAQDPQTLVAAVFDADGSDPADLRTPQNVSSARRTIPTSLRRELAGDLDKIVRMTLRKKPERRYSTANELGEDLRRYLKGHPVIACGDGLGYRAGKYLLRHRVRVAVTVALIWALIALGVITTRSGRLAAEHEQLARQNAETQEVVAFLESMYRLPEPMTRRGERPTADRILQAGARRAIHLLNEDPELGGRVMESIGGMYSDMGLEGKAEQWLRSASSVRENLGSGSNSALAADGGDTVRSASAARREGPFAVSVTGSCPEDLQFRVSGATPGASVMILCSTLRGSKLMGKGPCPNLDIGLGKPRLVAATIADAAGGGEVARSMPRAACSRSYYVEAIDLASCDVSPVVEVDPDSAR
jgi:serine/threonine protein kinase